MMTVDLRYDGDTVRVQVQAQVQAQVQVQGWGRGGRQWRRARVDFGMHAPRLDGGNLLPVTFTTMAMTHSPQHI
jgi:hypothetical protein